MITIGGVEYKTPYADLLPPLSTDEYEELRTDIIQRGIIVPVVLDELGNVIDGQHRLKIAAELGLLDIPFEIRPGMTDGEKESLAWDLNAHRRQMTTEQRQAYVLAMRQKGMSYRAIGDRLGVNASTVYRDIDSTVAIATVGLPEEIKGKDGKWRPATMPIRVDSVTDLNKATDLFSRLDTPLDRPMTLGDLRHEVRTQERAERRAEVREAVLPPGIYRVFYADPPWEYNNSGFVTSAAQQYDTMPTDAICEMEIAPHAADNAVLFMWATNPLLPDALRVMEAWGFEYKTNMVWVKPKTIAGFYVRGQHELLLIGVRGSMLPEITPLPPSVIQAPVSVHSAKPHEVYDTIEAMYPHGPYLELFARNRHDGWEAFGNEVPHGDNGG